MNKFIGNLVKKMIINKITKKGSGSTNTLKGIAAGLFTMMFVVLLPLILLLIILWNLFSNYQYCTLPFERECWKPDAIYQQDPVTDTEIEYLVNGREGVKRFLGDLLKDEATDKEENDGIIEIRETYKKNPDLDVLPEVYLSGKNSIPVLDPDSIMKLEGNVFFQNIKKGASKNTATSTKETIYQKDDKENVYKITDMTPLTDDLKSLLESQLKRNNGSSGGRTNMFLRPEFDEVLNWYIEAGVNNGIDPVFLVSISIHETGYFRSLNVQERNNVGGIRCVNDQTLKSMFNITGCHQTEENGSFAIFASIKDSINYKADLLRRAYAEKGFLTISQVGSKYAPLTDTNDPNALNTHWTTVVASHMKNFGIANVGTLTYLPPGVNEMSSAKRPNFSKYKPYMQEYSWMGMGKIQGDKSMKEYINKYKDMTNNKDILTYLDEKRLKGLSTEEFNKVVKSIGGNYKDGQISEAELQVRTLMQLDLQGIVGIDGYAYEAAHALIRTSRQLDNLSSGQASGKSGLFWNNEPAFNEDNFKKDKKDFIEFLVNNGYYKTDLKTDDINIAYFLRKDYKDRRKILAASARDGYVYPYLYIGLGEVHPKINDTDAFKKQVDNALKKLVEKEEMTEETLSALTVGHFLKRNALDTFRERYGWASFNKDKLVKEFRTYVIEEREKAENPEPPEGDFLSNIYSDFNIGKNTKNFWKKLTNYNYFDMAMRNNHVVRYAMFNETRELIEIGAWTRTNCFLLEDYDSFFCTKANASTYKDGIYTWEESDVLDKSKYKLDVSWTCVPKPGKENEEDVIISKVNSNISPTVAYGNDGAGNNINSNDSQDVAVLGFWGYIKDGIKNVGENLSAIGRTIILGGEEIVKLYNEGLGFIAYNFSSLWVREELTSPRDPMKPVGNKSISFLPGALDEHKLVDSDTYLNIYYELIDAAGEGTSDIQIGGVNIGNITISGGHISMHYIDIDDNTERRSTISKPPSCDPDENDLILNASKYLTPYYQTVYQAFTLAGGFNLYHASMGNEVGDVSSNLIVGGTKTTSEGIEDGGITGITTGQVLYVESTAYLADCPGCIGITKTGIDVRGKPTPKVIAVDPKVIPLGTWVHVEGYGEAIAGDTGGAIKGNIIDVLVGDAQTAKQWGRKKNVKVTILAAEPPGYGKGNSAGNGENGYTSVEEVSSFGTKGKATSNPNVFEWEKISDSMLRGGDTDIHPILAQRLIDIAKAYGKPYVTITSGGRSLTEQARLFKEKPTLAVAPGKSKHNAGIAVDISDRWLLDLRDGQLQKFGLHKPVMFKGEDWHIEVIESGTSVGKSNRSNAEIIQILGGVDSAGFTPGINTNINTAGSQVFRTDVLEFYKEMTNVDYVRDGDFIEEFEKYLTNRYGEFGENPAEGTGGNDSSAGANIKNPNPALFNGIQIQPPLNPNSQKLVLTSGFGMRNGKLHTGLDILGPGATSGSILAIADGTIYKSANTNGTSGWGSYIVIEHKTSTGVFYSLYAHMVHNSIPEKFLTPGASVSRGDVLGSMGNTGNSRGVHLHFNIYENAYGAESNLVDPTEVIGLNSSNAYCTPVSVNCIGKHGIGTK